MKKKAVTKKKEEERRRKKKECEQRRRDKIKSDPVAYEAAKAKERERWKKRKEEKKVKNVADMSERENRIQRLKWRKQYRKKQETKKREQTAFRIIAENSPPTSDDETIDFNENSSNLSASETSRRSGSNTPSNQSRQKLSGHKIRRRNYNLMRRVIAKQQETIRKQQIKINSLRVQKFRSTARDLQREGSSVTPRRRNLNTQVVTCRVRKQDVCKFLESDENSRILTGKKDTITRNKIKKQRRLLSDTLRNLYEKFISLNKPYNISYATFCRLKPFWVLEPNVAKRETCLCCIHENFHFMVEKLHKDKIINEKTSTNIARSVTCSIENDKCMMRNCNSCLHKVPDIQTFEDGPITYKKWIKISEQRMISGLAKNITRIVKKDILTSKSELVKEMINTIPKFLEHSHAWAHQSRAMAELRKNLTEGEVLVHMDFSENYMCKYNKEIQSVHFGASRQQITLHTVVSYYKSPVTGEIIAKSFCSLSENLRHDACAVLAHLKGILARLLILTPIKSLHILTDSPSAQYRNKKMFLLFSQHLVRYLNLQKASWHYHEASHGKGAPDGIGAYVKRSADRLVALGSDLHDLQTLYSSLIAAKTKVDLFIVSDEEICAADHVLSQMARALKPVKNTMRVHQVYWESKEPETIYVRRLTCLFCSKQCIHFSLGKHVFPKDTVTSYEYNPGPSNSKEVAETLSSSEHSDRDDLLFSIQDHDSGKVLQSHDIQESQDSRKRSQNHSIDSDNGKKEHKLKIPSAKKMKHFQREYNTFRDNAEDTENLAPEIQEPSFSSEITSSVKAFWDNDDDDENIF